MMKRRSAYILGTHLYIVHYDQQFILNHLCHNTGGWHDSESEGEWASDSQKQSHRCTQIVEVQMVRWSLSRWPSCTQWAEWPAVQDTKFSIALWYWFLVLADWIMETSLVSISKVFLHTWLNRRFQWVRCCTWHIWLEKLLAQNFP